LAQRSQPRGWVESASSALGERYITGRLSLARGALGYGRQRQIAGTVNFHPPLGPLLGGLTEHLLEHGVCSFRSSRVEQGRTAHYLVRQNYVELGVALNAMDRLCVHESDVELPLGSNELFLMAMSTGYSMNGLGRLLVHGLLSGARPPRFIAQEPGRCGGNS
jgi:hypothetical protein